MLLTKPLCRYGADWLQMWGANPEITEPDRSVAYVVCSLVLKYLQTGTKISGRPQPCGQSAAASWPDLLCQGNAPALLVQKCLLYWYKGTKVRLLTCYMLLSRRETPYRASQVRSLLALLVPKYKYWQTECRRSVWHVSLRAPISESRGRWETACSRRCLVHYAHSMHWVRKDSMQQVWTEAISNCTFVPVSQYFCAQYAMSSQVLLYQKSMQ
jgi:hypothetical protein